MWKLRSLPPVSSGQSPPAFTQRIRMRSRAQPDRGDGLAVEEDPLPDFEVHQQPEPVAMLPDARAVLLREPPQDARLKESPPQRPRAEHELLHNGPERPAQPPPHRHRKAHLPPGENLVRDRKSTRLNSSHRCI